MRADHYRIESRHGQLYPRRYATLENARAIAHYGYGFRIAAMNRAGKVLRYLPVNPKANR